MKKILLLIFSLSLSIQAAYNPFFTAPTPKEEPAKAPLTPTSKPVYKKVIVKPPVPKRQKINLQYFGFLETAKGRFALITFAGKTIVIKPKDSLYGDNNTYKIKKIDSNYLLVEDSYNRVQSIYFSSKAKK